MSDFKVVQPPTGSEVVLLPLSSALWGATCVQTFIYFMHFADKDSLATRLMVISLWIADTAHIVLAIIGVYSFEITHWGDLLYVESVTNQPFLWSLFFTALVACTVQLFFTYRIWKMRPGNPVSYILPLLAISQPALYTAFLVICYGTLTKSKLLAVVNLLLAEWAISAATDVLIAASLLYLIWSIKSESSDNNGGMIRSTGRILQRLVILTVNTGVWTAICSLFSIITATAFKATPAFTAVAFLICPLYCNTLLANLNMRETIRGDSYSLPVSKMTFAERMGGISASQSSTRVLEQNGSAEVMKTVNKSEDSVMSAKNA